MTTLKKLKIFLALSTRIKKIKKPTGGIINMDSSKIAKQMIDFQKTTFDNTFSAMVLLQEQAETMANTVLDQATWIPEEGRKAINDWVKAYKKGREEFKKVVDDNFKKVEDFFSAFNKDQKTKKQEKEIS
jgi:polyhydroxyalkanoate synthesis regulator phasin